MSLPLILMIANSVKLDKKIYLSFKTTVVSYVKYSPQPLIVSGTALKKSSLNAVSTFEIALCFGVSVLNVSFFDKFPLLLLVFAQPVKIRKLIEKEKSLSLFIYVL